MQKDKINKDEFSKMTKTEMVSNLFTLGTELLIREQPGYLISLYTLYGFFVEIWYEMPDKKIVRIEACEHEKVIANYESDIEIIEMF